jgi:hypothetical protein
LPVTTSTSSPPLPQERDAGRTGRWVLPVDGRDPFIFEGTFLGLGASGPRGHRDHMPGEWAAKGTRCNGCRWAEIRLFKFDAGYVIYLAGISRVPGETTRGKVDWAQQPDDVIELLTTRRCRECGIDAERHGRDHRYEGEEFFSFPAQQLLDRVTAFDDDDPEGPVLDPDLRTAYAKVAA